MTIEHFPTPMFFAHRGASAYAPENTIPAFLLARDQGAPAIELDVKLSADGEVVVLHDQTVNRTTNGHGDLRNFTLLQLKELDAGYKFSGQYPGVQIPTLREVFESVGLELLINIELTNYASPLDDLVTRTAGLVKQYKMEKRVLFSSFNHSTLKKAKAQCPEVPIGMLAGPSLSGWIARNVLPSTLGCDAIHPYFTDVNQASIQSTHKLGRRLHTWTVNRETDMQVLFTSGVDAIFTDDPILAARCLKELDVLVK